MKKLLLVALALVVTIAFTTSALAEEKAAKDAAPAHAFVGAKKCSMCHKGPAKGEIAETWAKTAHANAFKRLSGEESAAVMKTLKLEGTAQDNPQCLSCHVINAELKDEGVGCEACHGAGADYSPMKVMKDHDASVAAGMTADPKKGCVTCHNEKSPTHKGEFKFDEMWAKVAHSKKAK